MIHGHLHHGRGEEYQMLRELPKVLNDGVDVNFYRPVTLEQLVENNRAYYAGELDDAIPPPPRIRRGTGGADGWLPAKPDFRPIPPRPQE